MRIFTTPILSVLSIALNLKIIMFLHQALLPIKSDDVPFLTPQDTVSIMSEEVPSTNPQDTGAVQRKFHEDDQPNEDF
jgi:hypothetical protein